MFAFVCDRRGNCKTPTFDPDTDGGSWNAEVWRPSELSTFPDCWVCDKAVSDVPFSVSSDSSQQTVLPLFGFGFPSDSRQSRYDGLSSLQSNAKESQRFCLVFIRYKSILIALVHRFVHKSNKKPWGEFNYRDNNKPPSRLQLQ